MSSPPLRFDEASQPVHFLPRDGVLVCCPRCEGKAVVRSCRVTCAACGYVRECGQGRPGPVRVEASGRCPNCGQRLIERVRQSHWPTAATRLVRCPCGATSRHPQLVYALPARREGIDSHSGLPLWLAVPFRGRTLWAVNADHLTYLENYVAAGLREIAPGNNRLGSRIPAWIKSAKNRQDVVRALARLRAKLGENPA